jgi:hypothetical protein
MGNNPYQSSGDTGSGDLGVNLGAHMTGNPIRHGQAAPTVLHTWLIVVGALLLLWLLGGYVFKSIRMS